MALGFLRTQSRVLFQSRNNSISISTMALIKKSKNMFISSSTNGIQNLKITTAPISVNQQKETYEDAVLHLNSLQSNVQIITSLQKDRASLNKYSLPGTIEYLEKSGITMEQLDLLKIIHVTGTKGKGTTCAYTESILRSSGLRTGFFSSPHLVSVRERIRINGIPLSRKDFTKYFFKVYNQMDLKKKSDDDMPGYFRFLTIMAFYVFLKEKIDVALIEVGIGGRYDSTNIIRKPILVGITSLGLEHQNILGDTIEEIVDAKCGIMKPNVPTFTVHQDSDPKIEDLLFQHSKKVDCTLHFAPSLENYHEVIDLGVDDGHVSRINASLGLHLANIFLDKCHPEKFSTITRTSSDSDFESNMEKPYPLLPFHFKGLEYCTWAGRFQVLRKNKNLTYYIDGAHTQDSLDATRKWFDRMYWEGSLKILIFYLTGEREAETLLEPFAKEDEFDIAIFCPLILDSNHSQSKPISESYNWSTISVNEEKLYKCRRHAEIWQKLKPEGKSLIFDSVDSVINYLNSISNCDVDVPINGKISLNDPIIKKSKCIHPTNPEKTFSRVNVLVTGSLHLVGAFLTKLDPELKLA